MLSLLAESWTWYSFATLVILTRYISRYIQLGSIKALQPEEYVMLFVFVMYTNLVAWMNVVAHVDTNLMLPSEIPLLTPESTKSRIYGSKLVLVVEQSMISTQWGCKTCILLMYSKLTFGLSQQVAVKALAVYVALTFAVMEILYFGVWCRPFHDYWKVPVANEQCSAAIHHLITNAVFNISSDLMMLCIPLPLLITSKLPITKKLALCCLFGLGIFVIMCAILNKYYSFKQPFSPMWTFWYIREASTAVLVANIPLCWPLVRRLFKLRSFHPSSGRATTSHTHPTTIGTAARTQRATNFSRTTGTDGTGTVKDVSWWERNPATRLGKTESEENIVNTEGSKTIPLEIWQDREFDVVHDRDSETEGSGSERGKHSQITTTVTAARSLEDMT
ncbi:hypothetical protein F5884DRAFT_480146 [Xylogone sp. PMI_703]|nr:hypothetical protein F5884DRAFT_480146 [Xylogone sp. PMI_703]